MKELYSNYAAVESSFTGLGSGATLKFAPVLADGESSITGVTVSESGDVTVTKSYEGDPIKVTLTGKCGEHEVFSKEIAVTIPADKLNGTFAYSAEKPEDQGKLTYDVTSIEKRKEGLDLKTALVWKDATAAENKIWPEAAENIYSNNKPMTIYGFSERCIRDSMCRDVLLGWGMISMIPRVASPCMKRKVFPVDQWRTRLQSR